MHLQMNGTKTQKRKFPIYPVCIILGVGNFFPLCHIIIGLTNCKKHAELICELWDISGLGRLFLILTKKIK